MLYKNFNKPIIINAPIRYEHPLSFNPIEWEIFNEFIQTGVDKGTLKFLANNLYDKHYAEGFINRDVTYIPSLCTLGEEYTANKNKFILFSRAPIKINPNIVHKNEGLPGKYSYKDLLSFRAIIHIPYQVSTMSLFEHYSSNIPILFPAQEFLLELIVTDTKSFNEISWNQYFNGPSKSMLPFKGELDPNDYKNKEVLKHWIKYSDYYNSDWMPYITYFDSFENLSQITESFDAEKISNQMATFNIQRKEKIIHLWSKTLKDIYP
jgi:hypothetical protein